MLETTTKEMREAAETLRESADNASLRYMGLADFTVRNSLLCDLVEAGVPTREAAQMVRGATELMGQLSHQYASVVGNLRQLSSSLDAIEKAKRTAEETVRSAGKPRITIN